MVTMTHFQKKKVNSIYVFVIVKAVYHLIGGFLCLYFFIVFQVIKKAIIQYAKKRKCIIFAKNNQ